MGVDVPTIKALPLWQPWASLVIWGEKELETRHWQAPRAIIGQRIAIHATKTRGELWICNTNPFFRSALVAHLDPRQGPEDLPFGALIGTVKLTDCWEMDKGFVDGMRDGAPNEYAFGNYEVGRFAWKLEDPEPITPVPWKGSQGIFNVPAHIVFQ